MSDEVVSFSELGLEARLVRAAENLGLQSATAIQAAAIPAALAGRDVLGAAQTGSGKTLAYAFPLLQRAEASDARQRRVQSLVLVPTRELAVQVEESLRQLRPFLARPVKVVSLLGGVSINPQLMALRGGADLVIATPGRLLDVVEHNGIDLSAVRCLVLDEADRLLESGFADELSRVMALLPAQRQTLLFSATYGPSVRSLAQRLLRDPVVIDLAPAAAPPGQIVERAVEVDVGRRTALLRHLMVAEGWTRVLVFVATRYACDHVADKLRQAGVAAAAFHGDASQGARTRALTDFKAGALQVLVATDLGARGIHIDDLPVVVNHDLPRSPTDYVHRIGRTARAGADGIAVSFVSADTEAHFRLIEKRQSRRVPRERVPGFEPVEQVTADRPAGGVKGRRPSKKDKLRAAGLKPPPPAA